MKIKSQAVVIMLLFFPLRPCPTGLCAQEKKSSELQIIEARLGTDVKDRTISGEDSTFQKNSKVFLWMKLLGGNSDQITVTWKSGTYSHSTTLIIAGSPWRTWATKTVARSGEWMVTVTYGEGKVLRELSFSVR